MREGGMQILLEIFLVGTKTYTVCLIYILLLRVQFPVAFGAEQEEKGEV